MKKPFILIAFLLVNTTILHAQRYRGFNDYTKFRIGVQGGWGYRLAKVSSSIPLNFRNYVKQLKSGFNYGADASFFFNKSYGVGIRYSSFHAKNEMEITVMDTATFLLVDGKLRDNITIQYIGPSFSSRYISNNEKFHLVTSVSLGYLSYKDKATLINDFTLTGATLGSALGISADFAVSPGLFLGAGVSGTFGALDSYEYKDASTTQTIELPKEQREGLSRIDVSVGFHWNL